MKKQQFEHISINPTLNLRVVPMEPVPIGSETEEEGVGCVRGVEKCSIPHRNRASHRLPKMVKKEKGDSNRSILRGSSAGNDVQTCRGCSGSHTRACGCQGADRCDQAGW
jgi:hypothetical protein